MKANLRKSATVTLLALCTALAIASGGCAEKGENDASANAASASDSGLPVNSADVAHPKEWTELAIASRNGQNRLDPAGHFHTTSNICARAGDGVYTVDAWNRIAPDLDVAALAPVQDKPQCWDSPEGSLFYNNGSQAVVELSISHAATPGAAPVTSKRQLFTYKNAQICTTLKDLAFARKLMDEVEDALRRTNCSGLENCRIDGYTLDRECKNYL
jgi:hypothetical protein